LVSGNNYILHIRLKQNSNPSNNPTYFKMPVQVKYVTPLESKTIIVFNDVQDQGWDIPVNGQPSAVTFDPDNWILKDIVGTTSSDELQNIPSIFSLSQNYPNPFNPSTIISWQIAVSSHVTLKVYDLLGREVATLVDEFKQAGKYNSEWRIENLSAARQNGELPSGIYYYTLQAGNYIQTKKMVLIK
jgi:hypothetical protein